MSLFILFQFEFHFFHSEADILRTSRKAIFKFKRSTYSRYHVLTTNRHAMELWSRTPALGLECSVPSHSSTTDIPYDLTLELLCLNFLMVKMGKRGGNRVYAQQSNRGE